MTSGGSEAAARDFALAAHGDQRYGERPYAAHLEAVVAIVASLPADDDAAALAAVAWLHDVLEDTQTTAEALRERFGEVIAAAVAHLSDPPGASRRERKALLHRRLAGLEHEPASERLALIVKAADRLANARASAADNPRLLAMYRGEHGELRAAALRPGLCDPIWAELDALLG
ncbi:MAG: HD domain-containing protein [Myxococcales bacterium]|nr:HD domain-containing protein [Myxococcales bacterium]